MIVEIEAEVTKIEEHSSENHTGTGSCKVFDTVTIKGQWELPNGHPNLDCYGRLTAGDDEALLNNIGFEPDYGYEIEEIEVFIWGNVQEWVDQVNILHSGYYQDKAPKALDKMKRYPNTKLSSSKIERILEEME